MRPPFKQFQHTGLLLRAASSEPVAKAAAAAEAACARASAALFRSQHNCAPPLRLPALTVAVTGEKLPVRELAASADPLTRTYLVKLGLPAEADIPLGATAYVSLATAAGQTAIALPTSALMRAADGGTAVWVFDPSSSTVQPRTVQLAGADGNAMLVASGLKPGEEVVAAGVHVLAAGQKVTRFVAQKTGN